jgi:hypothetical protein
LPASLFVAIAVAQSAACAALSYAHLRRVTRAASPDLGALTVALKRIPLAGRLEELARRAPPGTWEHRLTTDLLDAPTDEARVAAANEALADMDVALASSAGWPRAAVRICARVTLLLAVVAFLVERSNHILLILLAAGGAGVIACAAAGRRARRLAAEQRAAIDGLVAALLGAPPSPAGAPPSPARPRRAGRH